MNIGIPLAVFFFFSSFSPYNFHTFITAIVVEIGHDTLHVQKLRAANSQYTRDGFPISITPATC